MKRKDFEKELRKLGATFSQGGKHKKVYLNGRQSTIPRHKELSIGMVQAIRRQLDIKN